ncbi:guanine deaminase [Ophiocordyceps sinensis CO18]|uniref:Guanine deaminase n=1 Tax=Ophiocordyceps sinensis (strain Co18 / CGMCC 3.14243) TaxID=911162 RepID=T5A9A8_OPHSC|nr:guanine deaminase [Ophiocordyceps sinensis CO18]
MTSAWSLERNQVLVGTFVHSRTREQLEVLEEGAVGVDKGGKIVGVETRRGEGAAAKEQLLGRLGWSEGDVDVVACKPSQFFFPGFIDTHVHAPQYPNVGIFGKTTVLDWLQKYTFPLEASLKDLARARSVYTACVCRTLAHGTTTAAYFATIDVAATNLLADLCLGLGQRAFVGRVCMDTPGICPDYYRDESADESLRATLETIAHVRRIDASYEIVSPILTPRFAPSCSGQSMLGLADVHRQQGLPIQTHISEHADDVKLATDLFPESGSYARIYDDHGLLTAKTILAHAVHLTEGEATLVPSVLEAARQAALVSRYVSMRVPSGDARERCKLTVDEVLYMATRGGADVVGLAHKVGGFDVGMHWDAQLVELNLVGDGEAVGAPGGNTDQEYRDGGNVDVFGWETWEEKITKWLYNGDDRNTKKVWVKGRLVHARP